MKRICTFLSIIVSLSFGKISKHDVYLLLSNNSEEIQEVDIEVKVDGIAVFDKLVSFSINSNDYEIVHLKLRKGTHLLEVSSHKENLFASESFFLKRTNHIFISFNYSIMRDTTVQRLIFYHNNPPEALFVPDSIWNPKHIIIKRFDRKIVIH